MSELPFPCPLVSVTTAIWWGSQVSKRGLSVPRYSQRRENSAGAAFCARSLPLQEPRTTGRQTARWDFISKDARSDHLPCKLATGAAIRSQMQPSRLWHSCPKPRPSPALGDTFPNLDRRRTQPCTGTDAVCSRMLSTQATAMGHGPPPRHRMQKPPPMLRHISCCFQNDNYFCLTRLMLPVYLKINTPITVLPVKMF